MKVVNHSTARNRWPGRKRTKICLLSGEITMNQLSRGLDGFQWRIADYRVVANLLLLASRKTWYSYDGRLSIKLSWQQSDTKILKVNPSLNCGQHASSSKTDAALKTSWAEVSPNNWFKRKSCGYWEEDGWKEERNQLTRRGIDPLISC